MKSKAKRSEEVNVRMTKSEMRAVKTYMKKNGINDIESFIIGCTIGRIKERTLF